jgi:hypothetical protein
VWASDNSTTTTGSTAESDQLQTHICQHWPSPLDSGASTFLTPSLQNSGHSCPLHYDAGQDTKQDAHHMLLKHVGGRQIAQQAPDSRGNPRSHCVAVETHELGGQLSSVAASNRQRSPTHASEWAGSCGTRHRHPAARALGCGAAHVEEVAAVQLLHSSMEAQAAS